MIDVGFKKGTEVFNVRVSGNQVTFSKIYGNQLRLCTIDGLKLNIGGILKEFPDLKGKPDGVIKQEAIKRFKEHIKKLKTEEDRVEYVMKDLQKHFFTPIFIKKAGFRIRMIGKKGVKNG